MNRTFLIGCCAFFAVGLSHLIYAPSASAQAVPFFNAGATSFTPQISIVYTGVINDVQATVSADRKYVTMTMRPQSSTLLNLRQFTFQQGAGGGGLVGGAGGGAAVVGGAASTPAGLPPAAPAPAAAPNILSRPGMTRVGG